MPTISMFYGILIRMFNDDHYPPHIHALYNDEEAMISFDGEVLEGSLPKSQLRLVQAWVEIHRLDLQANWKLVENGEALFKIEPLK